MASFKRKKKSNSDTPDGFSEKSWNLLAESWRTSAMSKQTTDLEKEIIQSVRAIADQAALMKSDEKLEELKEKLKNLRSFYTDTIAQEQAKVDFCVYLFKDRGMVISKDTKKAVNKAGAVNEGDETSD
ncbi:MAG: hypothetical protein WC942_01215 [Clostridia bacterium]|jgi:hypothetical protein